MDLDLKNKIAVITGGSVGIGLAVAEGLAQEGVHLALCARDETRVLERAKAISERWGVRTIGVRADVSRPEDIAHFVSAIEKEFGAADILINNAGTGSEETILNAPDDRWQYYWGSSFMAAVRVS
jgi:NAD(P)-dependent dehydrogenase (short-subunit alcohol dehydrogenase family)